MRARLAPGCRARQGSAVLKLRLAGRLRFEGAEIEPPASRRARGVLAYLALYPGPHSRAQLAARFWPDVLDESARTSLRAALTELRRALGPAAGHVIATRETVVLDDGLWVDTRAFDAALARKDAAAALDACSRPDPRRLRGRLGPRGAPGSRAPARRSARAARGDGHSHRGGPPDARAGGARPTGRGAQPPSDRTPRRRR